MKSNAHATLSLRSFPRALPLALIAFGMIGLQVKTTYACPTGGCTNKSLYGDYAFSVDSKGSLSDHRGVVGIWRADGAGNVTGKQTIVDDSTSPSTVTTNYLCDGTYSINSDGTGTVQFDIHSTNSCNDSEPPSVTIAVVLEDGGHGLRLVVTSGDGVSIGSGRLQ